MVETGPYVGWLGHVRTSVLGQSGSGRRQREREQKSSGEIDDNGGDFEGSKQQTATKLKPTALFINLIRSLLHLLDLSISVAIFDCFSMESAAILRSFHGAVLPNVEAPFFSEKPIAALKSPSFPRGLAIGRGIASTMARRRGFIVPYVKASETKSALTSEAATSDNNSRGDLENKRAKKSTFPNGFEALILNVCDETSIAELKLKVGTFEMHLKRDIGNPTAPIFSAPGIASPTTAPPIPSEPMVESASVAEQVAPKKSSPASNNPFANVPSSKAPKLAALEASGAKSFVLVSSPTVGTFRGGRTLKGKKQPPSCKEGDMIKEGQIIGYLDQFGNELPVRSDVAGEVLKLLFKDGEAVGYGDPLVAVLPSFHGIQ